MTPPNPPTLDMEAHNRGGNCFDRACVYGCKDCGVGNLCDVCHEHDEPRGECSECADCPQCPRSNE